MAKIRACVTVLLLALVAAAAGAQAPPPPSPELAPAAQAPGGTRREVVRLYLVQRMREALALSDSQTLKVMELLETIDRERLAGQVEQRAILESIRRSLESPTTPDERFRELVADFQKCQVRTDAALRDLDMKLLSGFTPRQQSQYIVLRRQLLEEIREEGLGPGADRPKGRRNR
jgi:hypothetical protein